MQTANISEKLVKSYSDRTYQHTVMISHKGTPIAFAMDDQRRLFYAVLDLNDTEGNKGEFDVAYWPENPRELSFPSEIEQVGYSIVGATPMPVVKRDTRQEVADPTILFPEEIDPFLSTTARLTADAPFQVFSDNQHIFVFRQAIANNHPDAVYKLNNGGVSGDLTRSNLQTQSDGSNVPVVESTLLCDRFILSGKRLSPNREVRYQRSRHKTNPASQTDSLGSKDMEGNPFYEPTQELAFIRNLNNGGFTVLQLPTQVNGIKRWQFFAHNSDTGRIDAFNLEVADDGLFNPQGTQLYTSPDPRYRNAVLEREPGSDPFTGAALISISQSTNHAETALSFDGTNHVDVPLSQPWQPTAFTLEFWLRPARQNLPQNCSFFSSSSSSETENGFQIDTAGDGQYRLNHRVDGQAQFLTLAAIETEWHHLAITYDGTTLKTFINGQESFAQELARSFDFHLFRIGSNRDANSRFEGEIDEVRIWDYARTGYDITCQYLMRLVGNEPGLVGYWRLDEGAGNTVFDQTDNGYDGTIEGNAQWVASEAPLGDHAGMRRSSFSLTGRTLVGSLAAKLYYQQEEQATGYDNNRKPMKKNARVMVTTATTDSSGNDPAVGTLDVAVSREGRLAGLPDAITLPVLAKPEASANLTEITNLEGEIRNLTDDIEALTDEIAELEIDVARIPSVTAEKQTMNDQRMQLLDEKRAAESNYMNYWCKLKNLASGLYMKTSTTNHGVFFSSENNDNVKWKFENWTNGGIRLISKVRTENLTGTHYLQSGRKEEWCFASNTFENFDWSIFYMQNATDVPGGYIRFSCYENGLLAKQSSGSRLINGWSSTYTLQIKYFKIEKTNQTCNNTVSELQGQYNSKVNAYNDKLNELNELLAQENLLSQKQALKLEKETLLQEKEDQLGVLTGGAQNEIRLPMELLHIDPSGLTVNGSLMKFATATNTPTLLDGATGELTLYYPDNSGQFMAAYFQTLVARSRLQFPDNSVTLFARVAGSNNISATISDGSSEDTCTLVITNSDRNITETWNDLPRDPQKLADILNGTGERPETVTATIVPATYSVKKRSLQVVALANKEAEYQQETVSQSALQFDGQNDYVELPPEIGSLISEEITLEFWAKGGPTLPKKASIIDAQSSPKKRALTIHLPWTNSIVTWEAGNDSNCDRLQLTLQEADYKGVWVHWAFVKNATDGTMAIYRNGDLVTSGTGKTRIIGEFSSLTLGRIPNYSEGYYWDGAIDECRIWNVARTQEQIQTDMNRRLQGTEPRLLACYSFENGQVRDRSGHGYHGTIHGNPTSVDKPDALSDLTLTTISGGVTNGEAVIISGRDSVWNANAPGRVYYFGSDSDLLSLPTEMLPQTAMNSDLTVEAWMNPSDTIDSTARLLHHNSDTAGYTLALQETSSQTDPKQYHIIAGISQGMAENHQGQRFLKSKETISAESWNHVALGFHQSYGLRFNGASYLNCGNNQMLDIGEDLTIEVFMQLNRLNITQGIISKGFLGEDEKSVPYQLYIASDNKLVFTFEDADGGDHSYYSNETLTTGQFYRIAVTRKKGMTQKENSGNKTISYKDADGNTQTKNIEVLESVDVEEWFDIALYINGVQQGNQPNRYNGEAPLGNDESLEIGCSSSSPRQKYYLEGIISEVRLWSTARNQKDLGKKIQGNEPGLVSWWQLEDKEGNVATDSKSSNHGKMKGARWVKNPDPQGSPFNLRLNGLPLAAESIGTLPWGDRQLSMAGYQSSGSSNHPFRGILEEVRIWRTLRTEEQIGDNLFTRLKGEKQDLLAYYTFDDGSTRADTTQLRDNGLRGNHLSLPSSEEARPRMFLSTAPIGNDTAAVRSALAGVETDFQEQIDGTPGVVEYADLQRDSQGNMGGVLKRCYSYLQNGQWQLVTGYKVGNLVTEWIGQAQFDPQVIGYVEGVPPVPSENLTGGVVSSRYDLIEEVSNIEIVESETVTYNLSGSKEGSFDMGFKAAASYSSGSDDLLITAPLGIGTAKKLVEAKVNVGLSGNFDLSNQWSQEESLGSSINRTRSISVELGGTLEGGEPGQQLNPAIGRRVKPGNMGFALVQSQTADIFALRLAHNNALVSFRMLPNPDIPVDWNIIPFPINPHYTKQGTLDGRVGYDENGSIVLDPDYANARQYGEYSYYKPKEAYAIEGRIQREEQRLLNYYASQGTEIANTGEIIGATAGVAAGLLSGPLAAAGGIAGFGSVMGKALDTDTSLALPKKFSKRNLVNTYVWTADGGFFAETTETTDVKSEVTTGSFNFSGAIVGSFGADVKIFSIGFDLAFEASMGGGLNITKTKAKDTEKSFSIEVGVDVPGDLQKTAPDESNEWKPVFDENGDAVTAAGKVDAYRFKTFYLDSTERNFEDLFGKVVDPIWLASDHPNAVALRQANQSDKKPPCWRVFHRVTFVSRILPDFPDPTAAPLESTLKAQNIDSNWQLIQKLDPFVRNHTQDLVAFGDATRKALKLYLPELEPHSTEIIKYLKLYYGIS